MNRSRFFFSFAAVLVLTAVFIFIVPSLVTPDLLQPQRIDSSYIEFQRQQILKSNPENFESIDSTILFNPADLGMEYSDISVLTADNQKLRGWYISSGDTNANSILVLHDWNESKILKLNFAKQMHDRGFNIMLIDLRAHGNSGGNNFSPGILSVSDVKVMLDTLLAIPYSNHVAIFGSGLSSGIALQSALYDGRADALVLQCPFNSFSEWVQKYSRRKWGAGSFIFHPVLQRKMEDLMLMPLKDFNLAEIGSFVETPMLLVAAGEDDLYKSIDSYAVYDSSRAEKKDLILVRKATHENIELEGGEYYFNTIGAFINGVLPKRVIKTRNRKMT
jgi:alpha-beta hydrolase superfamily lysophospholipase